MTSAIAILSFSTNLWYLLQITATSYTRFNLFVAKGQNVNSSGHGAAKDTCITVLKMAEKMAIQK